VFSVVFEARVSRHLKVIREAGKGPGGCSSIERIEHLVDSPIGGLHHGVAGLFLVVQFGFLALPQLLSSQAESSSD
jgi:hypothetical protein